jgi:Ni/Co efflux regulator RcnB
MLEFATLEFQWADFPTKEHALEDPTYSQSERERECERVKERNKKRKRVRERKRKKQKEKEKENISKNFRRGDIFCSEHYL